MGYPGCPDIEQSCQLRSCEQRGDAYFDILFLLIHSIMRYADDVIVTLILMS